jgi:deazaflavin-dependent oxidoreductase (nitroreductase family)
MGSLQGEPTVPKKASHLPKGQKLIDSIYITIVRFGLLPGAYLIKVPGRKSGKIYTVPLFVLHSRGELWLVAGFAQSDWVKNVRAAGGCTLYHDRREEKVGVEEIKDIDLCAALLKEFVSKAPGARRGFAISPDAPIEEYRKLAPQHPIFRVC